ncbi:E3 ubiquitin-protein ligase TRIM45-like [Saccostrea cucullata]|uniref:E3 ubiquitin-protein ligase TRIM45-like n=1 Tax=Saccostrea cuccullata TaxID=36930 RepID=UPI002ECFD490
MDEVPDTAQHFIECDTASCRNFSEFYCNTCHQRICDHFKQSHLEQNNEHEIVLYHERKRKLPSEKFRFHPTEDINSYCTFCQDPLCSTCFAKDHIDHDNSDLETIYNDILKQCQKEVTDIWKTVIPEAKDNVKLIGEKRKNVKREIGNFRVFMNKRANELKGVIDSILIDNNKKLDEIEDFVMDEMMNQQIETEDYITYLEKMTSDYECTLDKDEIAKQFGKIELNSSEKFEISSVTKVSEVTCHGHGIFHLSLLPENEFWARDSLGNLIQFDMVGNILRKISTSMNYIHGNHTVTTEVELLYTDSDKNTFYRVTSDSSINKLIETGHWIPGAIYSSHINGHILVGMERDTDNKQKNNQIQQRRKKVTGHT